MFRNPVAVLKDFLASEKASGFILIFCTIFSLVLANSSVGISYIHIWNFKAGNETLIHWINEGFMTFFFLLIGLELKREFLQGQFKQIKNAMFPIFAALGGMIVPAGFYALFNYGTETQAGAAIPMATDAAFALAILSFVGKRAPLALKMLLLAIAVVDDLFAIIVISVFYTEDLSIINLGIALLVFAGLLLLNKFGIRNLVFYILGGLIMWYFMLHSGVRATIAGVLLAVTIPSKTFNGKSPALSLQHHLHLPVSFIILPLFALSNTCVSLSGGIIVSLSTSSSIGILVGLVLGKPVGIIIFSALAVKSGIGSLHTDLQWKHVLGVGILGGIGFTISIFVTLLAFTNPEVINQSKIAVLAASVLAAVIAFIWLYIITWVKEKSSFRP